MKKPIYYRRFDYDKALIPNKYLASLEEGVSTIEQANEKTGFTIGYPGWNLVYDMVISHLHPEKYNIILETGTNQGCTTIILAQALKDSGCNGKVYTVELDKKNYETALTNLEKSGVSDFVEAVNASSHDFLKDFVKTNSSIRIAFLDASHLFDDVIGEFELILPLLGPQSIVIFDNTYQISDENEDQRVNGALKHIMKRHGGNLVNFETVSWCTPGLAVWQKSPFDYPCHQYDKGKIASRTKIQHKDQIVGLFSQAHNLAIGGDYAHALELYDKIITDVPTLISRTPQISYERALCLKALGKVHEAEQAIRLCLSVKPDEPDYLQFLSEIQFAIGSDFSPRQESIINTAPANIKQAEEPDRLYAEVKMLLPLVEKADIRLALKAISLIEKRIKGRLCGKLGDKVLQYLSIVQFVRVTCSKVVDSIEIGTLFGGSCLTKLFAMRDLGVGGKVICIDPMSGYYGQPLDPDTGIAVTADVFLENVTRFGFPKDSVELREVKSNDPRAMEGLREQFYATLMIDGDHSYNGVRFDWEKYNRFVSDKGIVLFDDYENRAWPDIGIFVKELKDSFPRGWKELGCLGTTLLLGREIRKSQESTTLREQQIERHQSVSTPLFQQRLYQNELVVKQNVSGMKKPRRILLYTDSRGKNIKGHCDYMHYGARLTEQFNVDMYLCPEKWTTTLDFLTLCKHICLEDYDAVVLHTGIVDAAPRHQKVAIEQIYSSKKAIFDEIFGEQRIWQHLNTDLGCEYEGDKTINLYSLDMARECLLPILKKIPNLIWIGGNRIVPGWRGNYWKERPANTSLVEQYFTLFASTLDHVINLMAWNYDEVRQYTFDNVHPNKTGSDYIYERLLLQIDQVSKVVQRTTVSSFPYSKNLLCSQNSEHKNELTIPHNRKNGVSTGRMTLEMLANKYSGRRAFIIGNGPSLNKLDMTKLKNEITFGVNSIFYNFDNMGFKPTFYVVEDKLVAEDRANEINQLTGMIKIFGQYTKKYNLQDKDDVIWANVIVDYEKYPDFPHFSENAATCLWVGGTVSYLCMQLAYHMGFDEVFLIGFDHNYVIPADANVDGTTITSVSDDPNHFHPEYFGKGKRWHDPFLDRMELAYRRARQVFEQNGRKIYNATIGGKLDIFPRVDYDRLFDGSNDCKYSSPAVNKETGSAEHAQTTISSIQDIDCKVTRLKREGTHFYNQGYISKAAAVFHRALTLAPKDAELLANLGLTSLKSCKYEKSPAYFKAAIHLDPENIKYWVGLAAASQHAKDPETFNLAHERIRNLDPAHFEQSEPGLGSRSWPLESDTHRSKEEKETPRTVSVIIPCYNTAKYLSQAIESVLKQTFGDFELIVVDDGSTDNTPEVVKSFEDDRIHYIYQNNKGLSGARNTGIRHSRGRYITFLDADDYFLPNKLKDQVTFLQEHPRYGLVAGGFLRVDQAGNIHGTFNAQVGEVSPEELLVQNRFVIHSTLIGRTWVEKAGCFDESLRGAEEWDFHCRLAMAGCAMYRTNKAVCTYRFVPGSMSTDVDLQTTSRLKVVDKVFSYKNLKPQFMKLEGPARGYTHLKGAVHYYSLNRIEEGRQHLAQALRLHPQLRENNYQKVVSLFLFWIELHQLKPPTEYLDLLLSNLPAEAEDMRKFRIPILKQATEKFQALQERLNSADSSEVDEAFLEKVMASSNAKSVQYKNNHCGHAEQASNQLREKVKSPNPPVEPAKDESLATQPAGVRRKFSELSLLLTLDYPSNCKSVLVDVGAHVGSFSKPFANRGWQVVAFEPEDANYQEFRRNLCAFPEVTCIKKAVSDISADKVSFYHSSEHWGIHSLKPFHPTHHLAGTVETIRLDEVLDQLQIDHVTILKIDVEGADFLALRSFDFNKHQPEVVICEFMDERSEPYFGYTHHDIVNYMTERDYTAFISEWAPIKEYGRKGLSSEPHKFLRCGRYLGDNNPAWGNLIFVPKSRVEQFEHALSAYFRDSGIPMTELRQAAPSRQLEPTAAQCQGLLQQKEVLKESNTLLAGYKDKHRGQRCVIIGNGPSLNKMDLSVLKNEITFGMNRIYLLFDKWDFRPTYFVSVNPLVIEQSVEEIRKIAAPKFLALEGLPFIGTAEENIFIQRRPGGAHFSDDPRNGCWWPTVTYAAMQLAYFMGFSEVILIGVDHYFKTRGDANKEIVSDGVDENHFHPDYFGKGIRWNLPDLEKSEVAYRLAKQAFEADGRRIIDATLDGHLTIFPKVDYKQIFDCRLPEPNRKSQIANRQSPEYLVSAIVSTYNSERFFRGCLDDLERQTIADKLEIIIVNSGSQENEEAIVREYQQKYNNIVYIKTEQREGIYAAWNRAVRAAKGTYLTNANTDDRHRKDALEIMAKTLQENPDVALVYGDQICTDTANGTSENHHATEMTSRPEYSRERLIFGNCVGSQPMWRRSLHNEFGYFDETLTCAGDWDFWLRISNKYGFKHISEFLGLYYYNESGIEHGSKIHSLYERYIVGKRYGNPYISVIPQYKTYDNPLVSVIMPAYNASEYIAEAIESVLIQNYRNFELVIINDGSTDNTEEIVAGFKDEKIRYFKQENRGLAATHNAGIRQSRGKFVTKLDADDKMMPEFIAGHIQEFEKHPEADLVYCDDCLIDENDRPIRIIRRQEYTDRKLLIRDMFRSGFPVVPFRTCIRRSVFDKIGFFDENLLIGEDYDIMRRFVKHGLKIQHLPDALYLRRMTENSLSRSLTPEKAKCYLDLVRRFGETFRYDELFPGVEWDEIPPDQRQLHAKCLAVVTYLAIGQDFVNSHSTRFFAYVAFERACSELRDCLKIDPNNSQIQALLQKCELGRRTYQQPAQQAVR